MLGEMDDSPQTCLLTSNPTLCNWAISMIGSGKFP
jgi:hypothetical protein